MQAARRDQRKVGRQPGDATGSLELPRPPPAAWRSADARRLTCVAAQWIWNHPNRHSGVAPCFVHAPGTHEINRKAFRKRRRIMEPWDAIVRAMAPDDDPCGGAHEVLNLIREPRPGEVVRLC